MSDPCHPIGPFQTPAAAGDAERREWIERIAAAPAALRRAVAGLSEAQLETPTGTGAGPSARSSTTWPTAT